MDVPTARLPSHWRSSKSFPKYDVRLRTQCYDLNCEQVGPRQVSCGNVGILIVRS